MWNGIVSAHLLRAALSFFAILLSLCIQAEPSRSINIDNHPLHVAVWDSPRNQQKPWVVLISGPIDSWHSDTAWFASAAPVLAKHYRVLAIDRAGMVNSLKDAPVGYSHFAKDLVLTLDEFAIQDATLIAFASSNISAQIALQNSLSKPISSVVLIDPDVLTEFSIARYSQDAMPFKDNLEKYVEYVSEGKYTPRVKQKNQTDLETLQSFPPLPDTDWQYVTDMMNKRLEIQNQINLFLEIARYQQDLEHAASFSWPKNIATVIIDTQFEDKYISEADSEEDKIGLQQWQQDAKSYYQHLANLSDGNRYIESKSKSHLFQFEQPDRLLEIVQELRKQNGGVK
ncbi:alpha/beta fold hydrolase [Aliiglaciecola lipolytica]|uniref:AB hydrolase-1 domain-containing protein n=1 Tax=Aliiglaciecola lipolytica E3 TaxID=1127673 RepID=K6YR87_9ALTE|nr:alpha/beta hydrolase [Aliiglaciecola lipolytica]GAC13795.1 hypothetical protein GLIP_1154 [Aliiglaciecola lipolytica E3]